MAEGISAGEFHSLIHSLAPRPGRMAVAVSGGPDSMALALLVKDWCASQNFPPPLGLIVDHALRNESADEAAEVQKRLASLGIKAEILHWDHAPVTTRIHAEARAARYDLLIRACRRHGIQTLLFAHQREDQAETILMRLAKGSGIDGLAGIPAVNEIDGVQILRPLLPVAKERLIATCELAGASFVTDPSNNADKFARGRLRRVMPLLADEGLTIERLLDCGARAAEAKAALDHYTRKFLLAHSRLDEYGVITIHRAQFLTLPQAIAMRSLGAALQAVHREDYDPTHAALSLLLDALQDAAMPARTLNGCLITCRADEIVVLREMDAITDIIPIRAGETVLWDGRWRLTLAAGAVPADYEIRALGNPPHEVLDRLAPNLRHQVPQGRVRATLPALWCGDELTMIPFCNNTQAKLNMAWPP